MEEFQMKMIFLGPPGAGKGTLAEDAVKLLGLPHISTGNIFRAAIAAKTPMGLKVKAIIDAGKLVDDETTIELVKERLAQEDAQKGYILDGFPRTIPQAEALAEFSKVDKVINMVISDDIVIKRLSGRRVCRGCGHSFHIVKDIPTVEGVCDHCGGEVYTRDDDKAEAIQKRLEVYHAQTAPLVDYYRKKGVLIDLDSQFEIADTMENFKTCLGL